jgi:DNA-binding transcriptional ArsR family regulator
MTTLFKALGDPTRLEIVRLLREKGRTPSELLECLSIAQPTLSHHLDILKRADLVETRREGQFIRYSLNMSVLDMALEFFVTMKKRR